MLLIFGLHAIPCALTFLTSLLSLCVCTQHGRDAAWIAFIDVDEFLFPAPSSSSSPSSPSSPKLPQILEGYKQYAGVVVPWTLFGSSNHTAAQPGLVIENYVWRYVLHRTGSKTCMGTFIRSRLPSL
jgi:hypothetical protein